VRLAPLLLVLLLGCGDAAPAPVELRDLVLQDSTYFDASTLTPFTGPIFSTFLTDSEHIQIEGALLDGAWDGEFRVYHRDGRIRYEGSFERGARCGAWTENTDPRPPSNLYDELVTVIETLAMYPPCSGGGAGGG